MSKYRRIAVDIKDRDALRAAIEACGLPCEVAAPGTPLALYGYRGDRRRETADVVIRRAHIGGAANDLGFTWNAGEGRFDVIISEYDQGGWEGTGGRVLNRIRQQYALRQVTALAEAQGYTVQPVEAEGGVIQLSLVRY